MNRTTKYDLENAVLRALGLQDQPVRKLTMTIEHGKLPLVNVVIEKWSAEPDKLGEMELAFKRFELTEIDDGK